MTTTLGPMDPTRMGLDGAGETPERPGARLTAADRVR